MPADAAVSALDCSFDQNFCNWSVDTQSVSSASISAAITTEQQMQVAVTTEKQVDTTVTTEKLMDLTVTTEKQMEALVVTEKPVEVAATTGKPIEVSATTERPIEVTATTEKLIEVTATTEKSMEIAVTTELSSPPTTITSISDSEVNSTPENDEQPIVFPTDSEPATTEDSIATTTADIATSTGIVELIESIPAQSSTATEARHNSVQTIISLSVSDVSPSVRKSTETENSTIFSSTKPSTSSTTTKSTTTTQASTTTLPADVKTKTSSTPSATSPSIVIKTDNVNKDSAVRGVSGLYDEITSFGGNTIEVISTSRDGATKSIIISQPVRNRFRRSAKWIGYNHPRNSRIVNYRSAQSSSAEEGVWRRPKPVPHWLRSRQPSIDDEQPESAHQAFTSLRTSPPKLFTFSSVPRSTVSEPVTRQSG